MAMWVGPYTWTGIGPFDFQKSRILLYFGYFLLGALAGNTGSGKSVFSDKFTKQWPLWIACCLLVYTLLTIIPKPLTQMVENGKIPSLVYWQIYYAIYVLSCTFSCVAFLRRPSKPWYIRPKPGGIPFPPTPTAFTWCITFL